MGDAPVIEAFPRRRLRLAADERRRRGMRLALGLIALLPGLWSGHSIWQDHALREDLRERGIVVDVLDPEGVCYSQRIGTVTEDEGCVITFLYQLRAEEGGGMAGGRAELPGDEGDLSPKARYDPANPGQVMLESAIARGSPASDWAWAAILLAAPLLGLAFYFAGSRAALARAARNPRPAIVPLVRVETVNNRVEAVYRWPEGSGRTLRHSFWNSQPLIVRTPPGQPVGQYALALLGRDGRPILLSWDLKLLDFTDEERAVIFAATAT